jgi:hypothetical protein
MITSTITAGAAVTLVGRGIVTGAITTMTAAAGAGIVAAGVVVTAGWFAYEWYQCMHPKLVGRRPL